MGTSIRQITHFDGNLIVQLYEKLGERNIVPNEKFFTEPNTVLLVAYTDGVPSGFVYGYVLPGLEISRSKMFLYSIDVFEEFRQKRVGRQLINELKDLSHTMNCNEMFVFTNRNNQAAMRLYRSAGGRFENGEDADDVLLVFDEEALKSH